MIVCPGFVSRGSLFNHPDCVSLAGRTYLAHRNQLKEAPAESRSQRCLVTAAQSERRGTKRGREQYGDDVFEDGDDSFYGFAADSFIFAEDSIADDVDMEVDSEREGGVSRDSRRANADCGPQVRNDPVERTSSRRLPDYSVPPVQDHPVVRRSTRSKRYKKDSEFVYY